MRLRFAACLLTVLSATGVFGLGAEEKVVPAGQSYSVLEVARFAVNRDDVSTEEAERAAGIPDEMLDAIHRGMLGEFTRNNAFPTVRKAADPNAADEGVLLISGRITDFKAGNAAARLMVGFGAGAQKIEAECILTDKKTGKILGKQTIVDRKFAGVAGGDEVKGIHDFAEKVLVFIKSSLPTAQEPRKK
jgi:hypothetical protein